MVIGSVEKLLAYSREYLYEWTDVVRQQLKKNRMMKKSLKRTDNRMSVCCDILDLKTTGISISNLLVHTVFFTIGPKVGSFEVRILSNSERTVRLVHILCLIGSHNGMSLCDLEQECQVSARTIYRDLRVLAEGGVSLFFDPQTKKYRVHDKAFLRPLSFQVEEATALICCAQAFLKQETVLAVPLRRALARLTDGLTDERKAAVEKRSCVLDIAVSIQENGDNRALFSEIEAAIVERRQVRLQYYSKTRDVYTDRIVDPYVITFRNGTWYLIAYCHLQRSVRIFRLDRIEQLDLLTTAFTMPSAFSTDEFFRDSWVLEQGDSVRVKLHFLPEAARWLQDEQKHPSQMIIDLPDGSLIYEVNVNGTREITRWILGYGDQVEVLEPVELREAVAEQVRGMAKRY